MYPFKEFYMVPSFPHSLLTNSKLSRMPRAEDELGRDECVTCVENKWALLCVSKGLGV